MKSWPKPTYGEAPACMDPLDHLLVLACTGGIPLHDCRNNPHIRAFVCWQSELEAFGSTPPRQESKSRMPYLHSGGCVCVIVEIDVTFNDLKRAWSTFSVKVQVIRPLSVKAWPIKVRLLLGFIISCSYSTVLCRKSSHGQIINKWTVFAPHIICFCWW